VPGNKKGIAAESCGTGTRTCQVSRGEKKSFGRDQRRRIGRGTTLERDSVQKLKSSLMPDHLTVHQNLVGEKRRKGTRENGKTLNLQKRSV